MVILLVVIIVNVFTPSIKL